MSTQQKAALGWPPGSGSKTTEIQGNSSAVSAKSAKQASSPTLSRDHSLIGTSADKVDDTVRRLFRGSNRTLAVDLIAIFGEMRCWWPLTVRQAYYQCVGQGKLSNRLSEYRRVSAVLTELRRESLIPWHAVADRTRKTTAKRGEPNVMDWLMGELRSIFNPEYYGRCYIQNQAVYIEVLVEKDALASIAESAVWPYCTRLNVTRGHPSASMQNEIAERLDKAMMLGKRPLLLHFGDLDPSGVAIPRALQAKLLEHHGLDVEVRRVALTPGQVAAMGLPESLDAAKQADPNYPAWEREYGDMKPVELDAMHPEALQHLIREALEGVYDMSEFGLQQQREREDRQLIERIRHGVQDYCINVWPDYFEEGRRHG